MALINNIDELQNEISRLTAQHKVQQAALVKRFNSPSAIISSVLSIFPKATGGGGAVGALKGLGIFNQDFFGLLSRLVLPFALNKTLFRKSNFLIKGLVSLISQKASHYVTEDAVTGIWGRVKSLFTKKEAKPKNVRGYGMPPM